jgi:hypothetical protein
MVKCGFDFHITRMKAFPFYKSNRKTVFLRFILWGFRVRGSVQSCMNYLETKDVTREIFC